MSPCGVSSTASTAPSSAAVTPHSSSGLSSVTVCRQWAAETGGSKGRQRPLVELVFNRFHSRFTASLATSSTGFFWSFIATAAPSNPAQLWETTTGCRR
ncbi:hypothetical protein EYF80_061556 [Liparis tanakae]|uniref:Uncharacterized protein n=1 Tax=Liparis tanakae TaxID=230148 RepID=A0A4Z2EHL0_9TELE|nr:hypothetical protein EYF80_061556 [Liparis tanakae]